ncbi:outer membrane beta-barrel protein [Hymenobacter glacialis]|uniref:Outer membrane protein beta-barrel domain-containing protein n=1 Tax=Hymenobacter glacialis TaxID=1908236 RepID=A0A1G1T1Z5_9BACT|nr:outer membrane beta-barrel protein [Hymenobacter glacialis]OGX84892.1 hypothetical protein BEN48_15595 [Hymenobacter glacialis]
MPSFSLLLLITLLSAATASAQTTYRLGLRGGINRATTTLDAASTGITFFDAGYSAGKSAIYSWQTGAVLEVAFSKFALQPALLFSQKGEQFNTNFFFNQFGASARSTNRYNWLELPVNAVYSVRNFQLFGGPYVALGVGGRRRGIRVNNSPGIVGPLSYNIDEKINFGSNTPNRRLDAGVNFGVGYRQGPMQVQLGYQLGLRNLHRAPYDGLIAEFPYHDFGADAAYNRVVQLTGTYFFEL